MKTNKSNTTTEAKEDCAASACSAPWLFPEIEAEVKEERSATMRESAQRIREEKRQAIAFLRENDLPWVIDSLLDNGPQTDVEIMNQACDLEQGLKSILTLYHLWRIGKFWRKSQGIHFGIGVEYYLYGIRKIHKQNGKEIRNDG